MNWRTMGGLAALVVLGCGSDPPAERVGKAPIQEQEVPKSVAEALATPSPGPEPAITLAADDGESWRSGPLVLPEVGEVASGPTLLGVPTVVVGTTCCAAKELGISSAPELAVRTLDATVYLVDDASRQFPEPFETRTSHHPVRVHGTPYLAGGQLRLKATQFEFLR